MQYILYDVDKIKDFVFDTFKPKEVKGASEMIKKLDYDRKSKKTMGIVLEELTNRFTGIKIVYSKGGGGLIRSEHPVSNGEKICSWLESNYPMHVREGNLTAVCHPVENNFQESLAKLNYKLRERKAEKILKKPLTRLLFTKDHPRCVSCGKRPAEKEELIIKDEKMSYCTTCKLKRYTLDQGSGISKTVESLEELLKINKNECPKLKNISDTNQILIIYGDLNEAGAHLASLKNEESLAMFSDTVYETLKDARCKIENELNEYGFKSVMPIIGGDDMLIFTHPNSFQLIKEHLSRIESTLQKKFSPTKNNKEIKMNFSFLLARYSLPIYYLFNTSSHLLDKTKKAYYLDEYKKTYYGFSQLRQGEYCIHEKDVYTKDTFFALFDLAKHLHGPHSRIKRSSLFQLLELISDHSKNRTRLLNTEYYLARHSEYEKFEIIKDKGKEDFMLVYKESEIRLTKDSLEDLIRMENLIFKPHLKKEDQ